MMKRNRDYGLTPRKPTSHERPFPTTPGKTVLSARITPPSFPPPPKLGASTRRQQGCLDQGHGASKTKRPTQKVKDEPILWQQDITVDRIDLVVQLGDELCDVLALVPTTERGLVLSFGEISGRVLSRCRGSEGVRGKEQCRESSESEHYGLCSMNGEVRTGQS
jgi:hypothetical protein